MFLINRFCEFIKNLWFLKKPKETIVVHRPPRRKVDTAEIRSRINTQGWRLLEIPIKHSHPDPTQRTIRGWKVVASRGDRSIEVGGATIDEAMKNIGVNLGVISKGS